MLFFLFFQGFIELKLVTGEPKKKYMLKKEHSLLQSGRKLVRKHRDKISYSWRRRKRLTEMHPHHDPDWAPEGDWWEPPTCPNRALVVTQHCPKWDSSRNQSAEEPGYAEFGAELRAIWSWKCALSPIPGSHWWPASHTDVSKPSLNVFTPTSSTR